MMDNVCSRPRSSALLPQVPWAVFLTQCTTIVRQGEKLQTQSIAMRMCLVWCDSEGGREGYRNTLSAINETVSLYGAECTRVLSKIHDYEIDLKQTTVRLLRILNRARKSKSTLDLLWLKHYIHKMIKCCCPDPTALFLLADFTSICDPMTDCWTIAGLHLSHKVPSFYLHIWNILSGPEL